MSGDTSAIAAIVQRGQAYRRAARGAPEMPDTVDAGAAVATYTGVPDSLLRAALRPNAGQPMARLRQMGDGVAAVEANVARLPLF